jgi:Kef-type K+ transport system membrane component KefB
VLGWASVDEAVELMSVLGLAFLLLLAGLELDVSRFRGRLLRVTAIGFVLSFWIALACAFGLQATGLVDSAVLIAIIASATSLGIVIPVLKDAGESATLFGQVVLIGASIADVATIVLLSLFFSGEDSGAGSKVVLLLSFAGLVLAAALAIVGAEHSRRISSALLRLQDTTAQIRVRGAFVLLVAFVVLAERFGLEAILGAFMAGAVIRLVDRDEGMTHVHFREKLTEIGFGIFVPFFFVASGMRFDGAALFSDAGTLALVPVFLGLVLAARALPALLYRPLIGGRRAAAAGLLQATTLGFVVVATEIGRELGLIDEGAAAAFIAAGLVSVLLFPLIATTLLRREAESPAASRSAVPVV